MGTRAQAFTAKIKNLQELQLRLIQEKYNITDTFQLIFEFDKIITVLVILKMNNTRCSLKISNLKH